MRNKTSRKMEDANIINLHCVRELIEDAKLWKDGVYVFKDAAGRVIAVDIINGRTALLTLKTINKTIKTKKKRKKRKQRDAD